MEKITGDIVKLAESGNYDVVIHGCNCMCVMGAGVAKALSDRWPEVKTVDKYTVKGDESKLGKFTYIRTQEGMIIVNLYTQYRYGRRDVHVDYDAIQDGFRKVRSLFGEDKKYLYPQIGAGLAGGDWKIIEHIIDSEFAGLNHTCVIWNGSNKT